jgi:hypothetical protein
VSRAIEIRVSESVVRTVHVEDGVQAAIELLPILPAARMAELLAKELAERGFTRDGDLARRTSDDGVEVAIDLRAGTVTARLADDAVLREDAERIGRDLDARITE